jgi:lipopolysaccharide transport protein LptA
MILNRFSLQRIYYYPAKQLIVLEGAATLEHQKDKFEGPQLSYHLEKQVISATSQRELRPTVILHPRG